MEGTDGDPFDWDVDKVVHELCVADDRPWLPRLATKRPDPAALSTALRDNDVDGETLLTYEDVMPSIKDLLETLGLKKPGHQMTLVKAIKCLKSKSVGYQRYKADSARHDLDTQSSSQEAPVGFYSETTAPARDPPADNGSAQDVPMGGASGQSQSFPTAPLRNDSVVSAPNECSVIPHADDASAGSPKKKRRLAPVLMSSDVTGVGTGAIPNAASGVTLHFPRRMHLDSVDHSISNRVVTPGSAIEAKATMSAWADATPGAYFGKASLITADWVPKSILALNEDDAAGDSKLVELASDSLVSEGKRVLDLDTQHLIPPGKRRQIHRAMTRLFRKNDESLNLIRRGIHPRFEPEDEGDEILPAFGESDAEEDYDSDTWQEMEDEREQLHLEKQRKSHILTRDDVERVMREEIQQMEAAWEERKLPRKQRRARAIWNQARRRSRHQSIAQASSRVEKLNNRIERLCNEMRRDEWQTESQLRRQMCCVEATVHDRQADRWLLDILRGPEPPGPETMPRLPSPTPRKDILSDEDGEIISSDDDDGFVVDDMKGDDFLLEPSQVRPFTPMDLDEPEAPDEVGHAGQSESRHESMARTPFQVADSEVIDLTGFDSEPASEKRRISINLVSPTKPKDLRPSTEMDDEDALNSFKEEDLDFPFNQQAAIGTVPLHIWRNREDRERLLICLLWRVENKKMKRNFFHIIRCLDSDEVWKELVIPALSHGEAGETELEPPNFGDLGNMMARLFRVFEFCKEQNTGAGLFKKIGASRAKKLKARSNNFDTFYNFVREHIAPYFVEEEESNLENSERLTDDDMEESPSKKRKKAVILDQTAKDLRENDMQRLQEQEKRRIELRKKLAASNLISSDKSRLIINESKQDDQGLIYVNEDIGKRIKEHQIQGVRFMWNQIICDPKVRQGCLLAHTMGLGKTMQVITLLVAIAEAAKSDDESIRSQIPKDLRKSKTLILCPALLVDNWMDELLMWAPADLLGHYFKLEAVTNKGDRIPMIRRWDKDGGVMVIGYELFKRLLDQPDEEQPQHEEGKGAYDILTQSPNIVVADEAHKMKNTESKIASAASHFRTHSRIALTGSPLANSVEEFYSMIDWVAPRYLGPHAEFNQLYTIPIQAGLYEDSTYVQFRKAKKQLSVLEKTVAPKAHRATVKSLMKNDLPQKTEFILTVPLESLQAQLYDNYISSMRGETAGQGMKSLSSNYHLALIVNHPRCWYNKLTEQREIMNGKNMRGTSDITLSQNIVSAGLKMVSPRKLDISSPKLSWKTRLLVAIVDECEKVGDKVLVFTHSIPALDYLDSLFRQQRRKIARLDGSTPINQRQQHIKNFNTGDTQIYLISTTAGGVGLNIFGANRVILFDFKYNPVHEQQAVGRAYRIGQLKPVYVYKFLSGGTFEAAMHNRAVFKTQLASRVVDKENPKRWSKKDNEFLKDREEPAQQDLSPQLGKDAVLDHLLQDPELSQGIRSIETTDTFEEQDPDEVLTAEDKKDVENQVLMNSLRITNPAEYRRLEQERFARTMPSMAAGPAHLVNSNAGPVYAPSTTRTAVPPPNLPISQASPQTLDLKQQVASVLSQMATPSGGPGQVHVGAKVPEVAGQELRPNSKVAQAANATGGPTRASPDSDTHRQEVPSEHRGAPPMPMAGANTFFRTQTETTPPIASQGPLTATQDEPKGTTKTPKRTSSDLDWVLQFEHKIIEALQKVTDPELLKKITGDHNEIARRIAQDTWKVRVMKKDGPLPDAAHMKKLCGVMASPRFAIAVLTGFLAPEQLALAPTFSALDSMEEELSHFSEEEFRETLGLTNHGPEEHHHLENVLNRSNANAEAAYHHKTSTTQSMNDLQATIYAADRRQHRRPRLPTWASKAVEEHKVGEQHRRPRDPFEMSPSPEG